MKVLIVHQYFNRPESGGPLRSYYLAKGLKRHGYTVEIITAHNRSQAISEDIDGITVHSLPVFYENRLGFVRRVWAFIKFAYLALKKAKSLPNIDLCYAISTPLTVGWIAIKLRRQLDIPFIFEVGDLWPEAPIQMGVFKNKWLIKRLQQFEGSVYRQATKVVALSPPIRDGILKRYPGASPVIIPNMADCNYFQWGTSNTANTNYQLLAEKFVVFYFGAAGHANHLEYLVEAAKAAKENQQLHFLVAAEGSQLRQIKNAAQNLSNITFLPYLNRAQLKEALDYVDAVYVSYAPLPVLTTGSPNKFFDGLAAGKLMVLNFGGWLRGIVEKHHAGIYTNPKHPESLLSQLTPFMKDRALLWSYQKNARNLGESYFSREIALQKLLKTINKEHQMTVKGSAVYTLTA